MSSYKELVAQAEALMKEAEKARKAELASVVSEIKEKMREYGITVADLGMSAGKKSRAPKAPAVVNYRGPNGETWAGGKGRKPEWVRALLAAGKDVEAYRV